ncbi:hypothetical protein ACQKM9_09145 [Viridibacillus sp. NPDC093762]|uniref:hypothetical protein n=1 Tax=Viridibacillus sp. NPDC093762 TaxID=3390720 RepID=UPI003CFF182B
MLNTIFTIIFIFGIYYLIRYHINLRKAIQLSKDALYPSKEKEFKSIVIPTEWREMECLSKNTKSYQYVKWGTVVAILLLVILFVIVLLTDVLGTSSFSIVSLFFVIISAIKHRGNLFILANGIIFDSKFYSFSHIIGYEVEKISRWHELYGLDPKINNGYKLTLNIKNKPFLPNFIVVKDHASLEKIVDLLEKEGISGIINEEKPYSTVNTSTNKF